MTFTSALGSQIPPHHFSPLLRNLINQEGKEEERNLSLTLPVAAVGTALSLAGACGRTHCLDQGQAGKGAQVTANRGTPQVRPARRRMARMSCH